MAVPDQLVYVAAYFFILRGPHREQILIIVLTWKAEGFEIRYPSGATSFPLYIGPVVES